MDCQNSQWNVNFTKHFENIEDPRRGASCVYPLSTMITLAVCACIGGANDWVAIERFCRQHVAFFSRFLDLSPGIPSHDTFSRVFGLLDSQSFRLCLKRWLESLHIKTKGEFIALDGKTLRGSFDKALGKSGLHLVCAWASKQRVVLGEVAVDEKSNEITAIPTLLRMITIEGATVTIDAIGCQKEIASTILAKNADYVLAVKDNHPRLHDAISEEFIRLAEVDFKGPYVRRMAERETSQHGRVEKREYVIVPIPESMKDLTRDWEGAESIGMVLSTRTVHGKTSTEVRYYLCSLEAYVKHFARAVRRHWGIENSLHWSLDVTFAEDASRIRKGQGPENMGILRRFVLSYLQQDTSMKDNIRGKRQCAGWSEKVLANILIGKKAV